MYFSYCVNMSLGKDLYNTYISTTTYKIQTQISQVQKVNTCIMDVSRVCVCIPPVLIIKSNNLGSLSRWKENRNTACTLRTPRYTHREREGKRYVIHCTKEVPESSNYNYIYIFGVCVEGNEKFHMLDERKKIFFTNTFFLRPDLLFLFCIIWVGL